MTHLTMLVALFNSAAVIESAVYFKCPQKEAAKEAAKVKEGPLVRILQPRVLVEEPTSNIFRRKSIPVMVSKYLFRRKLVTPAAKVSKLNLLRGSRPQPIRILTQSLVKTCPKPAPAPIAKTLVRCADVCELRDLAVMPRMEAEMCASTDKRLDGRLLTERELLTSDKCRTECCESAPRAQCDNEPAVLDIHHFQCSDDVVCVGVRCCEKKHTQAAADLYAAYEAMEREQNIEQEEVTRCSTLYPVLCEYEPRGSHGVTKRACRASEQQCLRLPYGEVIEQAQGCGAGQWYTKE